MKILHLINDHQVIERTIGVYEEIFPDQNEVLLFNETNATKHLDKYASCTLVTSKNLKHIAQAYDFSNVTHVIAHYMTMEKIDFIKFIPQNVHVCWEVYGYDLYNQFLYPNGYSLYYSDIDAYYKYYFFRKHFKLLFKTAMKIKGYDVYYNWQLKRQFDYIVRRIDSIQYCCSYDAKYIEDYANRSIPSYEVFNYSLTEVLGDLKDAPYSEGRDILVGNSASFSNNHLYALKFLKTYKLSDDIRFLMPLSYGGIPAYVNDVEKQFENFFSNQVKIIKDYLPLHEFNKIFLQLKSAILPAWRQESIGTIIMCLYLGIKVFMSNKSPLYHCLKEIGFILYELESAVAEDFITCLKEEYQECNRKLVLEHYDEKRIADIFRQNIK